MHKNVLIYRTLVLLQVCGSRARVSAIHSPSQRQARAKGLLRVCAQAPIRAVRARWLVHVSLYMFGYAANDTFASMHTHNLSHFVTDVIFLRGVTALPRVHRHRHRHQMKCGTQCPSTCSRKTSVAVAVHITWHRLVECAVRKVDL